MCILTDRHHIRRCTCPAFSRGIVLVAALLGLFEPGGGWARAVHMHTARYVVVLKKPSVTMYDLSMRRDGMADIKPDFDSSLSKSYTKHLHRIQTMLARQTGVKIVASIVHVLDAFIADLSKNQVVRLATMPMVDHLYKDRIMTNRRPGTVMVAGFAWADWSSRRLITPLVFPYVPAYLGLDGEKGVWRRFFSDPVNAGDGVVVASLDNGINPDSPSFSGNKLGTEEKVHTPYYQGNTIIYRKADGRFFLGGCDVGPGFTRQDCNTKLITARAHITGIKKYIASLGSGFKMKYDSPRDGGHHGSHTSGTMAGNYHVPVPRTMGPAVSGGVISGVAPGAKLAVYKIGVEYYDPHFQLWFSGGGVTSDFITALEDAVSQGVNVINLSTGVGRKIDDALSRALLNTAASGVIIVNATGNDNNPDKPSYYEKQLDYPWVVTVGASTVPIAGDYPAPQTMPFSTTGPVKTRREEMLVSPDIAAPGYAIVAASGKGFINDRGTSMASPHIAGLVALYLGLHPHARFGEVQSAIMGTAYDSVNAQGEKVEDLFAQGSGNADFVKTLSRRMFYYPALVSQWKAFTNYVSGRVVFPGVGSLSPTDINYPSAGVDMRAVKTRRFHREVIAEDAGVYHVTIPAFPGYKVQVTPILNFKKAGDKADITVTVTKSSADAGSHPAPVGWTTGYLEWHRKGRDTATVSRFPLAILGAHCR